MNDDKSDYDDEDDYDDDPTDGWDKKVQMLQNELATAADDALLSRRSATKSSSAKSSRAFRAMVKNKSPSKHGKKFSPSKENAMDSSPTNSPAKKKLVFGGSREIGKRISRLSAQRSPSKRSVRQQEASYADSMELSTPDKKHAQTLGVALRNLLKLPKAHKWVCYEFFYSNLDQVSNRILIRQ